MTRARGDVHTAFKVHIFVVLTVTITLMYMQAPPCLAERLVSSRQRLLITGIQRSMFIMFLCIALIWLGGALGPAGAGRCESA